MTTEAVNTGRERFPFTAIVGQSGLRMALLLLAVDPRLGGVLIQGEKGTAKTTAVRGLADLLPSGALGELMRACLAGGPFSPGSAVVLLLWAAAGVAAVVRWFRWTDA